MRFIEDLAKQMHLGKITLTVNKSNINSIAAYQKIGFKNAGSVVTDIGAGFVMDDFIMDKAL
jgi:RimJ/RimL family protein N-acetyltransferase